MSTFDRSESQAARPELPERVDHLIFGAADLDAGRDEIERLLGVRPVPGGRPPHYGTRNALLALGPRTYLEVLAPDTELPVPERGVLLGADRLWAPGLLTWVLRSESIDEAATAAAAAGVGLGPIESGSRETPGGAVVSWRLTDPYAMPLGGAVPFLIDWGATPHPAGAAPRGGRLVGLRAEHPEPRRVRAALAALGVAMDVRRGGRFRLIARIETDRGEVELRPPSARP